jgi:hypothetical protein
MTAKRLILFVLGLCALTLLGGVAAANLSILALGNTEGAFFFFLNGCGLAAVWTPVALQSSCRDVRDLHLGYANTGKHAFDLLAPVGLNALDDVCGPSILLTILPNPSP